MRGIAIREELTDEWQKRGAKEQKEYEILTAEISKASFGVTPSEYKKLKGLKRENLRDHMDDFELIFTMLSERSTTEIHRTENSQGMSKLSRDANRGGRVAGIARKELEKELGRSVVSENNFLNNRNMKNKKQKFLSVALIFLLALAISFPLRIMATTTGSDYWKNYFSDVEKKAVQKNAEKYTLSEIKKKSKGWHNVFTGFNIKNGSISSDDIKSIDTGKIKNLDDAILEQTSGKLSVSGGTLSGLLTWASGQTFNAGDLTGTYAALNGSQITNISPANISTGSLNLGSGILTASGVIASKIYPASDSATAFQINKADGTSNVLNVDTMNGRVGMGAISLSGNIVATPVVEPSNPVSATDSGEAGLLNGTYYYSYTYYTADGETPGVSPAGATSVTVVNKKVDLSGITVSTDSRVIGRKLYRTKGDALDAAEMQYLATIANNTATTYQDNIADASLGAHEPFVNSTAGEVYYNATRIMSPGTGSLSIGYGNGTMAYADVAIGPYSMSNLTWGYRNTAVGLYSQYLATTGSRNSSLGVHSLNSNLIGNDNAAFGYGALHFNLASRNTAVGASAAQANTTGNDNTAFGYLAGERNQTGSHNVSVGKYAGLENLGDYNTSVGSIALQQKVTGSGNTAVGYQAGMYVSGGGALTTSTNGIFIGYDARPSADTSINETVIGSGARGSGNFSTTIGGASNLKYFLPYGNVGINFNPVNKLDVGGNVGVKGVGSKLYFDTTGVENANYMGTTGDYTLTLRAGRGTPTQIDLTSAGTISLTGNVGISTATPAVALDVNGQVKIQKSSSQPFACDATHDGTIALTSTYRTCVCNGGSTTWVYTSDGTTSCVWQ